MRPSRAAHAQADWVNQREHSMPRHPNMVLTGGRITIGSAHPREFGYTEQGLASKSTAL